MVWYLGFCFRLSYVPGASRIVLLLFVGFGLSFRGPPVVSGFRVFGGLGCLYRTSCCLGSWSFASPLPAARSNDHFPHGY